MDTNQKIESLKANILKAPAWEDDLSVIEAYYESAQPYLIELYREAGYEEALRIEEEINDILAKSKSNVFESPIGIEAANCFHSDTWPIWCGDGVSVMMDSHGEPCDVLKNCENLVRLIREFVKVGGEYLSQLKK